MDPGVYAEIKWEYCTRTRIVGPGRHEDLSSPLGNEASLGGEAGCGLSVPPGCMVKMGVCRVAKTG